MQVVFYLFRRFNPFLSLYSTGMHKICALLLMLLLGVSCQHNEQSKETESNALFELLPPAQTGIQFQNQFTENNGFNFLNYSYVYNGGGVAVLDIDQDGLEDLYFSANQGDNKLYRNKGDLRFEDITNKAGVADNDGWTTGITILDVNNDTYPDIYVCKSGELRNAQLRKNKLFVNQKDGTFKEEGSQWKVDHYGFSTQAYPIDYDRDGDLDLYLVNHRPDFGNVSIDPASENEIWDFASDQLFRNDGSYFTNVSKVAGIQNKAWGLSAAIGDFNQDSWPDIYVCNDFSQPDFLYLNDGKGHFSDSLSGYFNHISMNSMGSDLADINNDQLPDLMVLDMSAKDHIRSKTNMPSMDTDQFYELVSAGYHYQYMTNVLQLNQGTGFSDISNMAHVAKTDWSWAPLLTDFDNDGWNDAFVTNGIVKDLGNVDFRNDLQRKIKQKLPLDLKTVLDMVPAEKLHNHIYQNDQTLSFTDKSTEWGLGTPTFSNGATYADLDNDGDKELIVNNNLETAFIYENHATANFIQLALKGSKTNTMGLGLQVTLYADDLIQTQELQLSRGFQSSTSSVMTFGVGTYSKIDSLIITWPDQKTQKLISLPANQRLTLDYQDAKQQPKPGVKSPGNPLLKRIKPDKTGISFTHVENNFDDYSKQLLLPWQMSQMGPFAATGDVNGDGLEDFFIGGAAGQSAQLYIQNKTGKFEHTRQLSLEKDKAFEDMSALFLDIDQDGDLDLYVVSGGNSQPAGHSLYQDRIYLNDGKGSFSRSNQPLKTTTFSGGVVVSSDIDQDGDPDLLVCGRHLPWQYPYQPKSCLLINENGKYIDKTETIMPALQNIGMITGAVFTDYDLDGDEDLLIAGEWMPITLFENQTGNFSKASASGLENTVGLWQTISKYDIDQDGDDDYLVGNLGLNSKYSVSGKSSFHIYCDDFDQNGNYDIVLSSTYQNVLVPIRGRQCSSEQMPFIKDKFKTYDLFAKATVSDIIGADELEGALHFEADILASVYVENLGTGSFKITPLPNEAQISTINDFVFTDIDNDQNKEILSVGNLFTTEVETPRLDGSFGHAMRFSNGEFEVMPSGKSGLLANIDARDLQLIKLGNNTMILVTVNNGPLQLYEVVIPLH